MRRLHLQYIQALIPEPAQLRERPVRARLVIYAACALNGPLTAGAEIEKHSCFLTGLQHQPLFQRAAGITAQFRASRERSLFHAQRIALRAVAAHKAVPDTVKAVRLKIAGQELPGIRLIVVFAQAGTVPVVRARAVQAHLEILVVDLDKMERKLHIPVYAQTAYMVGLIAQTHVKDFHRILPARFPGNEQGLACADPVIPAAVHGIAQPVPCLILGLIQLQAHGLPAH